MKPEGAPDDLAQWLEDSGRRRAIRVGDSPEELLRYLEQLSGKQLGSREDVLLLYQELTAKAAEDDKTRSRRNLVRETMFVALLALAITQYYFVDVMLQVAALSKTYYFAAPR